MSPSNLKSLAILLGTLATLHLVKAQASSIPTCATRCFNDSLSATGCAADDSNCLCSSSSFISSVLQCSGLVCSAQEQDQTSLALGNLCNLATSSSSLGTSTGTFSGTKSGSSSTSQFSSGVITITTTFPGGSTGTVTATVSATPSPPISFTTSIPVINPSSRPSGTSTISLKPTSVTTSIVIPPISSSLSSLTANGTTTTFSTVTPTTGNGVSTAPPASSSSPSSARATRVDGAMGGMLAVGLGLVGALAVLNAF
ncbi:hypothetical protein D9757_009863 [Collybiopsis confluens]|uniref:CFEM domain-containing protein n=1 Tax=Collybiopsis confluens TaxID=2823264 RepID=A0A8H5H7D1_9AGAR|nr:hypothetical protein D9757_009863 [Collybiopsis confluens]